MDHRKTIRSFSTNIWGLLAAVAFVSGIVMASPAFALPSLQLGPDCDPGSTSTCGSWTYVGDGDDTWYNNGTQPFTLSAYANALGGNGDYAWETAKKDPVKDPNQYAYLVAAVVPDLGDRGDIFEMTITGATLVASGYGAPPVEDPTSLAPHGIYDTYFEVYEFQFDGSIGTITDQQPGQSGTGPGYKETFDISWTDSTADGSITGIHFDLFTVASKYKNPAGPGYIGGPDNKFVQAFAPFSHDAQSIPGGGTPPSGIPEPGLVALFSMGLLGIGLSHRRRRKAS